MEQKSNIKKINYKIKIIDNFLNEEDFLSLCQLKIDQNTKNKFQIYHNEIDNHRIIKSVIDKNLLFRLHQNYHSKAIDILNEINPEKVKLYDYSDFTIIVTNKDAQFPIHDDTPNKLLSGVVYLYPEVNTGTMFYSSKSGLDRKIVEWKKNRGVFFSRKEGQTWHSYEGDGIKNRIVLVYNLMTYRVKEVFKIENNNYFLGNLRYKLNPYLFRFFKKTI